MSFCQVGDFQVQITEVVVSPSKLIKNGQAWDINLRVETEDKSQSDWYPIGVSGNYSTHPQHRDKTDAAVALIKLQEIGYQFGDFNSEHLQTLVGTVTNAHVDLSKCGKYHNVKWIGGGGNAPQAADAGAFQAMNQILQGQQAAQGGGFSQPAQGGGFGQPQPQQPAPGGFGAQQPQQPQQLGGFGQPAAPGGFGQ